MFRKNNLPELLAPAGDMECLYAAVAGGADAIYVGGKRFGARAFAKNFDITELASAVEYCHLHGVKLYVTLNTLIEDKEMADAVEYAAELYRIGIDALIVADLGVIAAIKRHIPGLELHASTQMSAHNTAGVEFAEKLGASRVVVARELSLKNIKTVVENSPCEIEVFLHGALCVCHSGQCLFSSMVGGRSGNRGECAQPCRLPFNGGYPLSLKDLSLADHIGELIDSGVASLKIEGRMKSPDYVFTVTSIYRRLLDEKRSASKNENADLRRAFSRSGFTDGYFIGDTSKRMTGIRSDEDKQQTKAVESRSFSAIRVLAKAEAEFALGKPSKFTLIGKDKTVTVYGAEPAKAENAPLTVDGLRQRLSKMGNTLLSLSAEDIEITLEDGINLPPSMINALRREAAEKFQSQARELPKIDYTLARKVDKTPKKLTTAQFFSAESFAEAVNTDKAAVESLDIAFVPVTSPDHVLSVANGIFLPPVVMDDEIEKLKILLENAKNQGIMYALVSNIGEIELAKSFGFELVGDFRFNITNSESAAVYENLGISHRILSPELTLPKARDIGGGIITYGRIPLMITERCFIKENFGCKNCNNAKLTDRKGEKFPIVREFEHRNIIFNSLPTYMGDRKGELNAHKLHAHHLIFSVEGGSEICDILRSHRNGAAISGRVRRDGRR